MTCGLQFWGTALSPVWKWRQEVRWLKCLIKMFLEQSSRKVKKSPKKGHRTLGDGDKDIWKQMQQNLLNSDVFQLINYLHFERENKRGKHTEENQSSWAFRVPRLLSKKIDLGQSHLTSISHQLCITLILFYCILFFVLFCLIFFF